MQFGHGKESYERLEMPTKMLYYQDSTKQWRFVCGHELETLVRYGKIQEADVLHNVKLGFYEHVETEEFKDELEKRLASSGKPKSKLIEDYLKVVVELTTAAIVKASPYPIEELNSTKLVLVITMPDNIGEFWELDRNYQDPE